MKASTPRLSCLLAGSEYHYHLPALELRFQFNLGDRAGLFLHLHEELHSELLMCHFPSPEAKCHLYLVALLEELFHRAHFNFVVMRVDIRAELDFFDLDSLLLLARLSGLLLCLEFILSEIHDLADRDFSIYRDFDEIETGLLGLRQRVTLANRAVILSLLIDELDFASDNSFINMRPFFCGRASYRTAYVTSPIAVDGSERGIAPDPILALS